MARGSGRPTVRAGGPWTSPPNWRHASKIVLTVVSSGHYSVGLHYYSAMPEEDDDSYLSSSSDEDDDMVNSPPNEVEVTLQAIDPLGLGILSGTNGHWPSNLGSHGPEIE